MMKRAVLIALATLTNLYSNTLDDKIKALKSAPKEERYAIMNQIKMELIKLNQTQRDYFLEKLMQQNLKNRDESNYNKSGYYKNINKINPADNSINHKNHNRHKQQKNGQKNGNKHK